MIRCPRCNMKVFNLLPTMCEGNRVYICRVCMREVERVLERGITIEEYFIIYPDKLLRLRAMHAVSND